MLLNLLKNKLKEIFGFDRKNQTILITTMGSIKKQTISEIVQYIEKLTEYKYQISEKSYPKIEKLETKKHFIGLKRGFAIYDKSKPIEIIITDSETLLYENTLIRGVCFGNTIYISQNYGLKETLIHEILHNFGLDHCNENCIMNFYSNEVWNDKIDKPNLCTLHKSKLSGALPNMQ